MEGMTRNPRTFRNMWGSVKFWKNVMESCTVCPDSTCQCQSDSLTSLQKAACENTFWAIVKILKTSKLHFAIGSDLIESKALHYHYLDLLILRTSADLEYYHSHLIDFFLIVLHLSDHMIIGCRHPGCLTAEYTFVFIAIFSYLYVSHFCLY